jgi:NAD(P) transhydrogenase subunit alpha
MIVGVPKETFPGERRVAIVPMSLAALAKKGAEVVIESGAGLGAGHVDRDYADKGARVVGSRAEVFAQADVVAQVRGYGANLEHGRADLDLMRRGQMLVATFDPLGEPEAVRAVAERGVTLLALEMIPRITRAQSMDVLSSMATIAGYKAVLIAAEALPKIFPMMMTAAGTIAPAKAFVVGVGVAGLQAISTARRLGAVVEAYDVRPAVKEQVESLGAKFVDLGLDASAAEDKGGYAKALGEEFYRRQREVMTRVVAENDVVLTTAAVPGKKAPLLVTTDMVSGMRPGSVVVDLAAERGGNCELTRPGQTVVHGGVTVIGPLNLPASVPFHASQMFAKNVTTLILHLIRDGKLALKLDDEIDRETAVTHAGEVRHDKVREALGMAAAAPGGQG